MRAPQHLDVRHRSVRQCGMKVARKSSIKGPASGRRATLTLSLDVYHKIDRLRGAEARSSWVQGLVEREEREREQFAQTLRAQYTAEVCRETLYVNDEFPVHEH